ncbi:MAG: TIGR01212 family radical SAM protein [Candidatus Cloacimonetes bacterium]|nr:TIGR01212 family radical SAM protein [Candidatus Cloacimonadota bacterium]
MNKKTMIKKNCQIFQQNNFKHMKIRIENRINLYSSYLKEKYGKKVKKICLSTGIVCPHREKTGGCIFCQPETFIENNNFNKIPITEQINRQINEFEDKECLFTAYFQDETSTAGEEAYVCKCINAAVQHPHIQEIIISTRPDYISKQLISNLKELEKKITLEIGLQSIHDKSLAFLRRGHDFRDIENCIDLCSAAKIDLGVHLIIGIPDESLSEIIETTDYVSDQKQIKFVKLHNLVAYRNTPLGELFEKNMIKLPEIKQYIDLLCEILPYLRKDIVITRLFTSNVLRNRTALNANTGSKKIWMNELDRKLRENNIWQGSKRTD